MRILLADDNSFNQEFAMALLRRAGYEVEKADNGNQAVDAVRREDYDVVLMDVQMPELDGVQATRQIRALPPPKSDIPIIALTAHAMAGAKEDYLAAGMDDYVSKPIRPEILLSKLEELSSGGWGRRADQKESPCPSGAVDHDRLNTLKSVFPPAAVREFLNGYLGYIEARITEILRHSASGDLDAVAGEAHTIIGVAGNVGAMRLSELAMEIERASVERDEAGAIRLVHELRDASNVASAELRVWLDAELSAA